MQSTGKIRYFLGANSAKGFYSLYSHLADPLQAETIYILKGGPGCGTSTLLNKVAQRAEAVGEAVEYIQCPGDPDALDGLALPDRKIALIDGTAPHVVEPICPGAVERYVDLSQYYDHAALSPLRQEIFDCMAVAGDCRKRAARCLAAAEEISQDTRAILTTSFLKEKAAKRAKGILHRELRIQGGGTGQVRQRFLDAITHQGLLRYDETAETVCKRLYLLEDSYGLAQLLLSHVLSGASAAGYDVVACPSPLSPDRLEHLLIPELSLGFLSACSVLPYQGKTFRKINMDAMADAELVRRSRSRLRFSKKISLALIEEAVDSLVQAKAAHDALTALYRSHVELAQVEGLAERLNEEIFNPA